VSRHSLLWVTMATAGCGPRIPPAPPLPDEPLAIARDELPGGTLRVLHTATVGMTEREGLAGGSGEESRAPVSVALFEHPTEGVVIIDAGFGRATATEPPGYPPPLNARLLDIDDVVPLVDVLSDVGLSADDIDQAFLTHLHIDHAGGLADLPGVTVRGAREEWEAGSELRPLSGYAPQPYLGHRFEPLVFDDGPVGPFAHTADVFGDGSLVALPAPGHTAGHTMYLVNLPEHSWLFTGDAAWIDANWIDGPRPKGFLARTVVEDSWKLGVGALWRIHWFAQQLGVTVVSGHEPANLERLAPWPEPLVP